MVRLSSDGKIISGPTVVHTVASTSQRFDPDTSHNPTTDQYLITWADGASKRRTFGQLVSDTGALVGGPVQLHAELGTHNSCVSEWPQHEYNPATGGYTLLYTYSEPRRPSGRVMGSLRSSHVRSSRRSVPTSRQACR